ncbi:O-Antigen ligase [Lacipirellula limnantheis]|uniref:O-Antigen ligase n=2 Tax=Lacipirellula limnantheis TaxID=2528024 RepID=A0A517TY92_9BACT|nr:O-Antigen ligase [Lacipirellula limnantheis]
MPALAGLPIFQVAILVCLALSVGEFLFRVQATSAARTPVSVCVNGLLVLVTLSGLANGSSPDVISDFAKAWVLYFLVLALVDSPQRLSTTVVGTAVSIFGIGLLMVLDHHTGMFGGSAVNEGGILRAQAVGGANFDANDTAALLVVAVLIFLSTALDSKSRILRWLCITFAIVSLYAIQLCNSRGSLVALITGLVTYVYLRWGTKGLKWGALLLPIMVAMVATDRMTDVSAIQTGTGQSRMQFWSIALTLFLQNPILGIGPGEFVNHNGMACHNSFLQAFAELGFVGGALFVGALYFAIASSYRVVEICRSQDAAAEPNFDPLTYTIPTLTAAYSASLMTLNHLYGTHTYLILSLSTVATFCYSGREAHETTVIEGSLIFRLFVVACGFIALTYVCCRVLVRW